MVTWQMGTGATSVGGAEVQWTAASGATAAAPIELGNDTQVYVHGGAGAGSSPLLAMMLGGSTAVGVDQPGNELPAASLASSLVSVSYLDSVRPSYRLSMVA